MRTLKESLLDDFGSQAADLRMKLIKEWIKKNNDYETLGLKFNPDGTIDIDKFRYVGDGNFPDYIDFNNCKGNFDISNSKMTSLRGCPEEVGINFYCERNQLTSLEGGPKEVGGSFYCYDNKLTSLEDSPKEVGSSFDCSNNQLTSLEGGPKEVDGNFDCSNNQLKTLNGGPEKVGSDFDCSHNKLKSFKDGPRYIKNILCVKQNDLDPDELQWIRENVKYYRLFA